MAWYLEKNQRIWKDGSLFVLHYLAVQRKNVSKVSIVKWLQFFISENINAQGLTLNGIKANSVWTVSTSLTERYEVPIKRYTELQCDQIWKLSTNKQKTCKLNAITGSFLDRKFVKCQGFWEFLFINHLILNIHFSHSYCRGYD